MTKSISLALILIASLSACGGKDKPHSHAAPAEKATQAVTERAPVEKATEQEPSAEAAEASAKPVEGSDDATGEPEGEPEQPTEAEEEPPAEGQGAAAKDPASEALLDPSKATEAAPAKYTVRLKTTKGDVLIDVTRAWSPNAADRFYNLVKAGYFTDVAFFRVIEGFMAQAGMHGDPRINEVWAKQGIPDEKPQQSNTRGMVSFAAAGADSRSNQFFINFADNSRLDNYPPSGFAPFGKVRRMTAVDRLYSGYGEGAPMGRGPSQGRVAREGNTYLQAEFPKLDYIKSAHIED